MYESRLGPIMAKGVEIPCGIIFTAPVHQAGANYAQCYPYIKNILASHMQKTYPRATFETPPDEVFIVVPDGFNKNAGFLQFYDEAAYLLAKAHKEGQWKTAGELEIYFEIIAPKILAKAAKEVESTIDPAKIFKIKRVHSQASPIGSGRTRPFYISYCSQKTQEEKQWVRKEASMSLVYLNQMLHKSYDRDTLKIFFERFCKGIYDLTDSVESRLNSHLGKSAVNWKKYLDGENYQLVAPAEVLSKIVALKEIYLAIENSPFTAMHHAEICQMLVPVIKKERAYAMMAARFGRILSKGVVPLAKLEFDFETSECRLISKRLSGETLTYFYNENYSTLLKANAPQIAAAALLRYILGVSRLEVRLDNMLISNGYIVPIDLDMAFADAKLVHLDCDLASLDSMVAPANRRDKAIWREWFNENNMPAVKAAMLEMYQRGATMLTDDLINEVVDKYATDHEGKVFLPKNDLEFAKSFMRWSRETCRQKLEAAHLAVETNVKKQGCHT